MFSKIAKYFFKRFFLCIVIFLIIPLPGFAQEIINIPTAPQKLSGDGLKQYDFFYAGEQKNREMYIVKKGKIVWSYKDSTGRGEISDAVLMNNGNVVFAHQFGVSIINKNKQLLWHYQCENGKEIHTAQPIGNSHIIFIENSDSPTVNVYHISTNKLVQQFRIQAKNTAKAHTQFRHARLTKQGTYLVAHMDFDKIIEYDFNGKIVNSIDFPSPWSATELENGNILAVCNKNIVREITKKGETVWEFTSKDIPEYRIFGMQTAYRLANGNTIINNWYNQWKRFTINVENLPVQFIEITPDKKVVWALREWQEPSKLGPSTTFQMLNKNEKAEIVHFGNIK